MKQIIKTLLSILRQKGNRYQTEISKSALKTNSHSLKSVGARLGAKSLRKLRLETIKPRN